MYALVAGHMDAETRMLLQPSRLMLTGILPIGYRSEATLNEELEARSVRTTAPWVRVVAAATRH